MSAGRGVAFGTDGIRGPSGVWPIDPDGAVRVGAAAAAWASDAAAPDAGVEVWVARDTRPSGASLANAVLAGAAGQRARVVDAGVLPSGGLGAVLAARATAGVGATGVMVTASHNPAGDNGFKVLGPGGHKPDDARTAWLETRCAAPSTARGDGWHHGASSARETWWAAVAAAAGPWTSLAGTHLVVDLAHGAASAVASALDGLRAAGVRVDVTGAGEGTINDGVGSEHPRHLAAQVRRLGADAGIAVDGDADRCVLVDERGQVVPGDALTAVLVAGRGVRRLAVTVMSTWALEGQLPSVEVVRTPVGDRHLAALLRDGRVDLGAEESGHVLLGHPALPGGDGLATGLAALVCARTLGHPLSAVWAPFAPWPRRLTKVRVARRPPLDALPDVRAEVAAAEAGLRGGRVLLRYSGTEPVLRVLVEGPSADDVASWSTTLTRTCQEALG
ncbi:MAG: phosphoglucosamine mutase [Alphaproteobacteria bacterium]|nr:phosphoglucosamine mutase [Alphaproteobacteria bacterium]